MTIVSSPIIICSPCTANAIRSIPINDCNEKINVFIKCHVKLDTACWYVGSERAPTGITAAVKRGITSEAHFVHLRFHNGCSWVVGLRPSDRLGQCEQNVSTGFSLSKLEKNSLEHTPALMLPNFLRK